MSDLAKRSGVVEGKRGSAAFTAYFLGDAEPVFITASQPERLLAEQHWQALPEAARQTARVLARDGWALSWEELLICSGAV